MEIDKELPSPIDRLDAVLKWFATSLTAIELVTDLTVDYEMRKKYPEFNDFYLSEWGLNQILHKLKKEGFIDFNDSNKEECGMIVPVRYYFITFDGELFYLRGGYKTMYATLELEKKLSESRITKNDFDMHQSLRNGRILNRLTLLLVVALVIQILWDVWKFYHTLPK